MKKIKSILYVEDEINVQNELAEFLENFCDNLYTANNGFEGLELFKKYTPEIIITDIKMPTMDGLEMTTKIKEISEDVSIVFTTAFSDVLYFQEAIELQVEGFILKPISLDALDKKLCNLISSYELKKELEEKEQMLIQSSKLAAMGEMIGNIAHQWRQPLSMISTIATSYELKKELGEEINLNNFINDMDTINKNAQYLSHTIDDFRSFFTPTFINKKYSLKEYIDKCIDLVTASFDSNTIRLIKEIDEKINSYGDPKQLLQALINILNNAKDAFKNINDSRDRLVFIISVKEIEKDSIIIEIKDNAGGIPEEILPRIFEPYFTTKDEGRGTGLGLYITHTIITKHLKGKIKVENESFEYEGTKYVGAKFSITLPLILSVNDN
ncbi:response regulator [uncultured Arcobacter sp.]|uniref:ATP-binding response regulator n=1 Tax=uncultured Arcobacter sp. TaxID=165434 RepID=UPI0026236F75|nr:response regulator [uncultured Arcobacter sp.]